MCLKHLDLCSGIGGFALALQSTGYFKTIGFCEIDPFCQKVLKKNFPGVPIYNDIKEFKPNDEGLRPDIITAGFPCQPFSIAGKRKSEKDDRNLWKETFRVIKESRPAFFIGENVGGIVKLYLDTILEDLESANYSTRCFNISASSIGANHQRARIWIVANSRCFSERCKTKPKQSSGNIAGCSGRTHTRSTEGKEEVSKTFTDSLCEGLQGHDSFPIVQNEKNGFFANSVDEAGATENWWEAQSKLFGIPDGLRYGLHKYRTNRIMALGNAVCPQIPFLIGKAIGKLYE